MSQWIMQALGVLMNLIFSIYVLIIFLNPSSLWQQKRFLLKMLLFLWNLPTFKCWSKKECLKLFVSQSVLSFDTLDVQIFIKQNILRAINFFLWKWSKTLVVAGNFSSF